MLRDSVAIEDISRYVRNVHRRDCNYSFLACPNSQRKHPLCPPCCPPIRISRDSFHRLYVDSHLPTSPGSTHSLTTLYTILYSFFFLLSLDHSIVIYYTPTRAFLFAFEPLEKLKRGNGPTKRKVNPQTSPFLQWGAELDPPIQNTSGLVLDVPHAIKS